MKKYLLMMGGFYGCGILDWKKCYISEDDAMKDIKKVGGWDSPEEFHYLPDKENQGYYSSYEWYKIVNLEEWINK